MKKAITVVVILVLHFVTACAPAAPTPTPTPQPRATPVEVLATAPEHLAGIWLWEVGEGSYGWGGPYYRWDADGTVWRAADPEITTNRHSARFWFEDGLYHEDEPGRCPGVGVYEVHLEITGGRAVRLRMELHEEGPRFAGCDRRRIYQYAFRRVD
jgi:hypothetical protein